MATIYVDNKPYAVKDGQNLLQACLALGFDIPYFCWHPALGSVGACRQCAVKQFKDENDTQGRIVMSCMTPAVDGTRISIDDPEVRAFRAAVIAWLMTNHPHDCPVCDEGGECHLQDMTVMTGHVHRAYRFGKRTYVNQNLGPFLNHEMNRCIQCYRCVRFYADYAGGRDLVPLGTHNHVYFGRHEDGALDNEFSGNLVEICPTGVFTDKSLKQHYTRPWDLQTAPSVCIHCGLGCNVAPGERYGEIRRIRNRYNGEVNGYFLCDRGRYGYEFMSGPLRLRQPLIREPGEPVARQISKAEALQHAMRILSVDSGDQSAIRNPQSAIIGIGSPRASVESNFALRALVGADRFFVGMSDSERACVDAMIEVLRRGPVPAATLREVREADAVLVLGEDLMNTAPLMALNARQSVRHEPMGIAEKLGIPAWNDAAVRGAVQEAKGPLYCATVSKTRLDDVARRVYRGAPEDLARLGFAVAHAIDADAPEVAGLPEDVAELASEVAQALLNAKRPMVISGPSYGSEAIIRAAAQVAWALRRKGRASGLAYTAPECNSVGLCLMGGGGLGEALRTEASSVIVLENDLYRRAERGAVDAFLKSAKHVVVIDCVSHETAACAEMALPAAAIAEGDGTLVNNEGRAQRFVQVFVPEGDIEESWRWLGELRAASGRGAAWENLDVIVREVASALPGFSGLLDVAPAASARFVGQRLPRQPHRYSGRTAMRAHLGVSEPKIPEDPDSAFTFSMEGYRGVVPSSVIPSFWKPGWNSVQSLNKFQDEIGGALRGGDPGVRLIVSGARDIAGYWPQIPEAFERREAEWWVVPAHRIFGSEELSALSPPIAARGVSPFIALDLTDAWGLRVCEGDMVELHIGGTVYRLAVKVSATVPGGIACVPMGMRGLDYVRLPAWGRIVKGSDS